MSRAPTPRLFSIPFGAPFLPAFAEALLSGRLIPGFPDPGNPLALADATIYVPTRRAARALRAVFAERRDIRAAILPSIRPLGEFDDDFGWFDGEALADAPIDALERRLRLAPLVRKWKERLPLHLRQYYAEGVVVPATAADALWLADDLAHLIDEVESEGASFEDLKALVEGDFSAWWQVTLEFLRIVTEHWPAWLVATGRADPAAWRNRALAAEAARLKTRPPDRPVIAAGSTGSIRATAELLKTIASLPQGAVVLPGFDAGMGAETRRALDDPGLDPTVFGHPQYGLATLLRRFGAEPADVTDLATPPPHLARRGRIVAEALRPAEATASWPDLRRAFGETDIEEALAGVALVEAATERDEAVAIAVALRRALEVPGAAAALVTPDRALARRVSTELLRHGVRADDSGGTPISVTPQGEFLRRALEAALRPGDPVAILSLLKHPLTTLGLPRAEARRAAEAIELAALRGGVGRPDIASLPELVEQGLAAAAASRHPPAWRRRIGDDDRALLVRFAVAAREALSPLTSLRAAGGTPLRDLAAALARSLEALAKEADGALSRLYDREAGEALAAFLRSLIASEAPFDADPDEAPEIFGALLASVTVKPRAASPRIAIWGSLEARLQTVDVLVIGGVNEGVWPRQTDPGQFLSRIMKAQLSLTPPERQIGQAAHDFFLACGAPEVVLTRAARSGDAPAVASRWLERLDAFVGPTAMRPVRARGDELLRLARRLDQAPRVDFAPRPQPAPPPRLRPKRFSVTEIETLRRDPYAIYARRILDLQPLEPLLKDPGAAERGTLLHAILARLIADGVDPVAPGALKRLVEIGREEFAKADLPADVVVAWWPRFEKTAAAIIDWETNGRAKVAARHAEARASATQVGDTGVTLSGYADRVDLSPDGAAQILDFKTGSSPSTKQAHTLLAPQLALEAALLKRGAFAAVGPRVAADLAHVRLKANGEVKAESILAAGSGKTRSVKTAEALGEEAWARLIELLDWFAVAENGYRSRVLPMRQRETDGDYDHLARVLEWSAGALDNDEGDDR